MTITEQEFYHYIPSATNPESYGIFQMITDELEGAKGLVSAVLDADLTAALDAAENDELADYYPLCCKAKRLICLIAFDKAIPGLDLVLTPAGFGVVSNQNVAPASADRVERLRKQIRRNCDDTLDDLLESLRGDPLWQDTNIAKHYFQSLIWKGSQMTVLGYPDEGRSRMVMFRPSIRVAETELIRLISPEQHQELTEALRHRSDDPMKKAAIAWCQSFLYANIPEPNGLTIQVKNMLLKFLDDNIEHFPLYRASSAYTANHYIPYQNQKDDTCYIFG